MKKQRKWNRLQGIAAIAGVLLVVLAALDFLPAVNALLKSGDEQAIRLYFRALGLKGVLFLILLQAVQVITSLIPALSLQAAAGASYGPLLGTIIILTGMVLGNGVVYLFAEKLLGQLSPKSKITRMLERFRHWLAGKNKELYCFLMFLLPVLPNLVKPYLAAVSDVRWPVFLFSCALGSIIPVLAGSLIGNFLIEGRMREAMMVALAAVLAALAAAWIQKRRADRGSESGK